MKENSSNGTEKKRGMVDPSHCAVAKRDEGELKGPHRTAAEKAKPTAKVTDPFTPAKRKTY